MTFLIILDGADERDSQLPGLDNMPFMREIIRCGVSGTAAFYRPGREVDSLCCIAAMLGVPAEKIPVSRAPLEAMGAGIPVAEDALVLRCNLVTVQDGRLTAFNGGRLTKADMRDFALKAAACTSDGLALHHLSEYRNLLMIDHYEGLFPEIPPPHQSIGRPVGELLAPVQVNPQLSRFIARSGEIKNGYMLYPWAAGKKAALPGYKQLTGKTAGCVCKAEIVAGIARAMGMTLRIPPKATGDLDTDLSQKAHAAAELSKLCDTVIIHVNGTDELSHRRNFAGKISFLERIDAELIGELTGSLDRDARFIITADHVTGSDSGCHERLPVSWHCADYYACEQRFVPPPIERKRSGDNQFYSLLLREDEC